MAKAKVETVNEIQIERLLVGRATVWVKGTSPLICNAMSAKAMHELLFPRGKKTAADRSQNLKHDPEQEYRDSVYHRTGKGDTRITLPAACFKGAMCNAALEIPGAKKAQVGRLVWVIGDTVDIYGVPKLLMSVVRSADMNHTPDVRTRAILPEWACCVTVSFAMPTMNETAIIRLLETAGVIMGVGDFRQQKGKGNYGQFGVCNKVDVEEIIKSGGQAAQDAALKTPVCYDAESETLLAWFNTERKARGK